MATAIDVVKAAETNTAQFVIDQMKKENADSPQITQILEEIGEESADFERHMKAARTANWEAAKNQQMFRENNFLLAFGQAQNPEALKWCESLFQLELTNDLAKLAIEIAFPPNSLNAWISSGRTENNTMFNSFAVCKLTALIDTIVTRTHSLIPRQDMREAANLNNLVLISALFHKLIADFETANNDVIRLAKLREESKSAQNILKLCLSVLDAKFNEFKKHALDTISAMDVIRKGITEDDEGANAQSK
uniref:DUF4116 domain-containing protein n=1 Tax=Globodera pallida TaxID=36090 RepID=A0A183C7U7_GLOPA